MQEVRVNVLSRLCTGSGWHAPNQPLAPLPQCLGKALYDTPDWYNDPDSEATSFNGTQLGATCGLFAVNHLLVSAAELGHYEVVLSQGGFEKAAIDDGHAVTPGAENYELSVLTCNLEKVGLRTHPMTPSDLQGFSSESCRLLHPFSHFDFNGMRFRCVGYLLRTPQCGGHWIALLPSDVLGGAAMHDTAGVLCDSLYATPYALSAQEIEELLTACALLSAEDPNAPSIEWGCFLITDAGELL